MLLSATHIKLALKYKFMLKYYLYLLFLTTYFPLIATQTCYLSFNQETTQRNAQTTNLFHVDQYKHAHNHNVNHNLFTYSASDLKNYFNFYHYSEKEILFLHKST